MRITNMLLGAAILLVLTDNAYAYLDPGTASIALQVIIGAVASGLFMIKLYWSKFKALIGLERRENDITSEIADSKK